MLLYFSIKCRSCLAHYDTDLPLIVVTDASAYGVGAIVSHVLLERPMAYASRTLSNAESKYSQIEKDALSKIFGVHKFHKIVTLF